MRVQPSPQESNADPTEVQPVVQDRGSDLRNLQAPVGSAFASSGTNTGNTPLRGGTPVVPALDVPPQLSARATRGRANSRYPRRSQSGTHASSIAAILARFRAEHGWQPGMTWNPYRGEYVRPGGHA